MCVSTAVAAAILVAVLAVCKLVFHNHTWEWLPKANSTGPLEQTGPASTGNDVAFLFVVGAIGVLALITAGLLLHLCFFHVYISFLGLTTYEYIRQQRQQAAASVIGKEIFRPRNSDEGSLLTSRRHLSADLLAALARFCATGLKIKRCFSLQPNLRRTPATAALQYAIARWICSVINALR